MQAVSQASSDKLSLIEEELRAAREETADVRAALDKAWSSEKELKRNVHELRAETEDLKAKLGAGESQVEANEEARRELANREALLQANQRQLQDTLTRNSHEVSIRDSNSTLLHSNFNVALTICGYYQTMEVYVTILW